jgi:DNA-binding transcriptional LysR family regulator
MFLNERILKVVVTLAEELHFGRAATKLHLSQPALSGTIKNLESELGVCLFKRTNRNVELTDAGRIFASEAQRLTDEAKVALALVRTSAESLGPLRIGYPASVNLQWLWSLISRSREYFGSEIQFFGAEAVEIREGLISGTLDAAFLAGPLQQRGFESQPLFQEPLIAAFCSRRPLASSPLVTFDQLAGVPAVWLRRDLDPFVYDGLLSVCSSQAFSPNIVHEARTFYECLEAAKQGVGITFLPLFLCCAVQDGSLAYADLPAGTLHIQYTLVHCRARESERFSRFARFVEGEIPAGNSTAA